MVQYELGERYAKVKSEIIKPENYEAVKNSWKRLLVELEKSVEQIAEIGPDYVPQVDWETVQKNEKFPPKTEQLFKERGCLIVRGVVPSEQAIAWKKSLLDYVTKHSKLNGAVFKEAHWSKCQAQARSHPNVIKLMEIAGNTWLIEDKETALVDNSVSIVYPDRARIRNPGKAVSLALHQDSGSIERWEDPKYRDVYREIWEGRWEDWNPWLMDRRLEGAQDLYGDLGVKGSICSTFRALQGWIGLSSNLAGEGTIKFLPNLRHVVPYLLLRPFFGENDDDAESFETTNSYFPGTRPGTGSFFAPTESFPRLLQEKSVISIPSVNPGDFVYWHADLLHEVDKEHNGTTDSSVAYIGHSPLSKYNFHTLRDTAEKFTSGEKPRDWEYVNQRSGHVCESDYSDRSSLDDILSEQGFQALGLKPFDETDPHLTSGARKVRQMANRELASHHLKA